MALVPTTRFILIVSFLLFLSGGTEATFLRYRKRWCLRLIRMNIRPLPKCCERWLPNPSPVLPPIVAPMAPVLPPTNGTSPIAPRAPTPKPVPPSPPTVGTNPTAPRAPTPKPVAPSPPTNGTNPTAPRAPTPKPVAPSPPIDGTNPTAPKAPIQTKPPTNAPIKTKPPTMAPIKTKPPTMAPIKTPTPCDGNFTGTVYGDPNVGTFDNQLYACQGEGEFVMFSALPVGSLVQGRFEESKRSALVTLPTGVVARGDSASPVVQISMSKTCPDEIELYVNGALVGSPLSGYADPGVTVTYASSEFTIVFAKTGLTVLVRYFPTSHLNLEVRTPCWYTNQTIVGLLGTPDGTTSNDWMDPSGTTIPIPVGDLYGALGYNYCVKNWCISNKPDSLFVHETECTFVDDFAYYYGCNKTYAGAVDLTTKATTEELRALCLNSTACLVDGTAVGMDLAKSTLEVELKRNKTNGIQRNRLQ